MTINSSGIETMLKKRLERLKFLISPRTNEIVYLRHKNEDEVAVCLLKIESGLESRACEMIFLHKPIITGSVP